MDALKELLADGSRPQSFDPFRFKDPAAAAALVRSLPSDQLRAELIRSHGTEISTLIEKARIKQPKSDRDAFLDALAGEHLAALKLVEKESNLGPERSLLRFRVDPKSKPALQEIKTLTMHDPDVGTITNFCFKSKHGLDIHGHLNYLLEGF
jgi:hypothetical protein